MNQDGHYEPSPMARERAQVALYEATDGTEGNTLEGRPIIVLSHTGAKSGLPSGNYATMFFVRGPYNPASTGPTANQTAQFCRQCHGGDANEMNGSTAGTTF